MADKLITDDLINAAQKGSQEAITELYNHTYQSVYFVIRSMIRADEETVQDLIQDTYLKAFQKLNQLRESEKFSAWVKKIARNSTVDYLRKNKEVHFSALSNDESFGEFDFEDEEPSHMPDLELDRQETSRILRQVLDSLPNGQRAIISMHYLQDMPVEEIAVLLGKKEGTIKAQLSNGRKNMAKKIREMEQKENIKLYGLSPIPVLLLLLRNAERSPMQPDAAVLERIIQNESLVRTSAATNAAKKMAEAGMKPAVAKGIMGKIAAGALAATVLCGGAVIRSRVTHAVQPEDTSPSASEQMTVEVDYDALVADYTSIIKGEMPIHEASVDLNRSDTWSTPACASIDSNGYFVTNSSSTVRYSVFEYDINGDQINELITYEEYKVLDFGWEGTIIDIFTFYDGQPVLLISGEYRGWITLCKDGVIRYVGTGGAEHQSFDYYKIQDGKLELIDTGLEAWENYSVNGHSVTNQEFYEFMEQYPPLTDLDFELVTTIEREGQRT